MNGKTEESVDITTHAFTYPTKAKIFTEEIEENLRGMNSSLLNKPQRRVTKIADAEIMEVIWYSKSMKPPKKKKRGEKKIKNEFTCAVFVFFLTRSHF